jgi:hypothetical protein
MQMHHGSIEYATRRAQLRSVAEAYFSGLERADFNAIPYAENITLRAPLAPEGVHKPLVGRKTLEEIWWAPLKGAIGRVTILDHYINEDATAICTQALVSIGGTDIVLRVVDRFAIDSAGRITEQENHFDPRDVTNPGWATASHS